MKRSFIFLLLSVTYGIIGNFTQAQSQEVNGFTPKPYVVSGISQALISLNGQWDFNPSPPLNFWKRTRTKHLKWESIQVPGEWVMQGFTVEPGSKAAYAKRIEIPADWKNHQIMLRCDAVYSLAHVFFNGKLVGSHEGGFTPFELNLTNYARPGKINELILSVQNESTADTLASASQYAAHQLGGITRKIEIFALPDTHISKLHLDTDLDENFKGAMLSAKFLLAGDGKTQVKNLKARLILNNPLSGEVVQDKLMSISQYDQVAGSVLSITMPVLQADLWDPEHPNLYDVYVILENDGKTIEKVHQKIGFREINVVGNQVFVNGIPIKLRGVNRHEVHPTKGRSLSMDEWLADAKLFKEANVNYIRTSHYPPAEEFISICDSIGLFVELEAPVCWVGHGANNRWQTDNPHDNKFTDIIRQQVLETVEHYRNHPSIIIWSMANESAWGPIWASILPEINRIDPSRPVSFHDQSYGGFNNYGSKSTQIANIHYPGPKGPDVARKYDRPLLFGEYAHLNTYNRQEIVTDPGVRDAWGRGLESMWENMYHSTGCLGGAIWSGVDDVFYMPDGTAVGYGEWGPIDGYRRPKPEYWHLKKIYSPIKIVVREVKKPATGKPILIPVENRQLFTNMSELEITWSLGNSTGQARMDLEPRQSGLLKIWPDIEIHGGEEFDLVFTSPQGYVIDEYRIILSGAPEISSASESKLKPQLLVLERKATVIHGDAEWVFDAPTGKLREVRNGHKEILSGGPELFLIPLKTGPCNTEHSLLIEPLNYPCQEWSGRISASGKEGNSVFIEVQGSYKEAEFTIRYLFDSTSQVKIDYSILAKEDINPRQIGLIYTMPYEYEHLAWERNGQWSIYPENHIGRTKGKATPFPNGMRVTKNFGDKPAWGWEEDTYPMGSNDFRASRDKLIQASLTDKSGSGIRMHSDGTGAFRAFVDGNTIRFLGASFSTAGGDLFFSSHLASERQPLKKDEVRKGHLLIEIL
ncbi:MAG: glycoside hydrolase family 2 [Bacteroidales bacterium]|nr:glycoside hydrolase family 2 [Bacteroidales bacterium]